MVAVLAIWPITRPPVPSCRATLTNTLFWEDTSSNSSSLALEITIISYISCLPTSVMIHLWLSYEYNNRWYRNIDGRVRMRKKKRNEETKPSGTYLLANPDNRNGSERSRPLFMSSFLIPYWAGSNPCFSHAWELGRESTQGKLYRNQKSCLFGIVPQWS